MISDEELKKVIDKLLEKTKLRELDWQTDTENGTLVCNFPRSSILIAKLYISAVEEAFKLSILNESGDAVGTIDTRTCNVEFDEPIATLYQLAERQALSIDETLDDILSNLD